MGGFLHLTETNRVPVSATPNFDLPGNLRPSAESAGRSAGRWYRNHREADSAGRLPHCRFWAAQAGLGKVPAGGVFGLVLGRMQALGAAYGDNLQDRRVLAGVAAHIGILAQTGMVAAEVADQETGFFGNCHPAAGYSGYT